MEVAASCNGVQQAALHTGTISATTTTNTRQHSLVQIGARSTLAQTQKKSALVAGWRLGLAVLSRDVFGTTYGHKPFGWGATEVSKGLKEPNRTYAVGKLADLKALKNHHARSVTVAATTAGKEAETSHSEKETSASYRPVVILPGLGNNTGDYAKLEQDLAKRGLTAVTAQVARPDWLRNAAGLLDGAYWKGELKPRPVLDWYLHRTRDAIAAAKSKTGSDQVTLLAHSAGGWLARVYLSEFGTADVASLVSLGSPHLPPPRGVPGVFDQTRGLLYHVEDTCPGAYHDDVRYVCIAGRYMKGARFFEDETEVGSSSGEKDGVGATISGAGSAVVATATEAVSTVAGGGLSQGTGPVGEGTVGPSTWNRKVVGQGYKQVCGDAEAWGDGVVPEQSAHLEGAVNVTLDGVYHSPVGVAGSGNENGNGAGNGNGNGKGLRVWYGSPGVLEQWVHYLME